jgi:hypothetical protein
MSDAWDDIGSGIVYQPSTLQRSDLAGMPGRPTKKSDIQKFIKRRHPEFGWFVETSRWILDTLEGGEQYRDARYGTDRFGKEVRNLVRSRREYPLGGIAELDWWGDLPPPRDRRVQSGVRRRIRVAPPPHANPPLPGRVHRKNPV